MFKVVITGANLPHVEEEREVFSGIANVFKDKTSNREDLRALLSDADAIMIDVGTTLDRDLLSSCGRLKVIVAYGVGVDIVDLQACTELGIYVCNLPGIFTREVAELAIGLIFSVTKEIARASIDVKQKGKWDANLYNPNQLAEKILGLIGFGRIGQEAARIAGLIFKTILAYDPYTSAKESDFNNLKLVNLDELLLNSDVISIHVPLNDSTKGLIGIEEFKKMKSGAFIVNVARGPVIDEDAMIENLRSGKIAGVGLDVTAIEPINRDNKLLSMEKVIITPHLAWKSESSPLRLELAAANLAKDVLLGKEPKNLVNKDVLKKNI